MIRRLARKVWCAYKRNKTKRDAEWKEWYDEATAWAHRG